jgi:hypothetical protein
MLEHTLLLWNPALVAVPESEGFYHFNVFLFLVFQVVVPQAAFPSKVLIYYKVKVMLSL